MSLLRLTIVFATIVQLAFAGALVHYRWPALKQCADTTLGYLFGASTDGLTERHRQSRQLPPSTARGTFTIFFCGGEDLREVYDPSLSEPAFPDSA
jgi:hypothetical protein